FTSFALQCARAHPYPHSFPTRRSSDLNKKVAPSVEFKRTQPSGTRLLSLYLTMRSVRGLCSNPVPKASQTLLLFFIPQFNYFHRDRKSTRLNSSHVSISYAVFCLKKKK